MFSDPESEIEAEKASKQTALEALRTRHGLIDSYGDIAVDPSTDSRLSPRRNLLKSITRLTRSADSVIHSDDEGIWGNRLGWETRSTVVDKSPIKIQIEIVLRNLAKHCDVIPCHQGRLWFDPWGSVPLSNLPHAIGERGEQRNRLAHDCSNSGDNNYGSHYHLRSDRQSVVFDTL
jgi:hypothetical protein